MLVAVNDNELGSRLVLHKKDNNKLPPVKLDYPPHNKMIFPSEHLTVYPDLNKVTRSYAKPGETACKENGYTNDYKNAFQGITDHGSFS